MIVHVCACVVQVCAACDALVVPSVCMAWHRGTKKLKCVKHTPIDQNMSSMFN